MDAVVLRPLGLAATLIGCGLFVVTLPFTAAAKNGVSASAHDLVVRPAQATFTRPMGDFRSLDSGQAGLPSVPQR